MQPNLPSEIQLLAERQAAHCRVMGNSQRIMIMWLLAERERTVTEIALAIGSSMQSTSHHLRILEFSKMVKSHRERHNIYYSLLDNEAVRNCPIVVNSPKEKLTEPSLV
jgi:DNA-binding transcriptional ArsR family regulator